MSIKLIAQAASSWVALRQCRIKTCPFHCPFSGKIDIPEDIPYIQLVVKLL
jgi:hypothetical protein